MLTPNLISVGPIQILLVDIVDYGRWWDNDTLTARGSFLREARNGGYVVCEKLYLDFCGLRDIFNFVFT